MSNDRKPGNRRPRVISPARTAAFDILQKIESEGAYSSVLLPLATESLDPRDRALSYEITLGVLRKKLLLDHLIGQKTRGKKLDPEVEIAIRIGLYQLLFLDRVPKHAAIDESVSLAARAKKTSAKGLVNAILRAVDREGGRQEFPDYLEKVSIETSHPQWLLDRWAKQFGSDEAGKIAEANNSAPKAAFRLTARSNGVTLPEDLKKSEFVEGCLLADRQSAELRKLADEHLIYFQDEGSQLVGQIAAGMPGRRLLDLAAAPGSKTTQIAATGHFSLIVAGDIHGHRIAVLSENCRQQGVDGVRLVQYDAEDGLPFAEGAFDTILLDAPCSGTGTIRHNPEIRYNLNESDISDLSAKQRRILENASKLLAPGGRLVYSTCSLEKEENEDVIQSFLTANIGWKLIIPQVQKSFLTAGGFVRTFPNRDQMDGFFVAVLEKD